MAPSGDGFVSKSHFPVGPCAHLLHAPARLVDLGTTECACLGTVFKLPMTYVTVVEDLLMVAMAAVMLLAASPISGLTH
jgi:hypothetical protein